MVGKKPFCLLHNTSSYFACVVGGMFCFFALFFVDLFVAHVFIINLTILGWLK